jgi:hypothetical protein
VVLSPVHLVLDVVVSMMELVIGIHRHNCAGVLALRASITRE